MGALKKTTKIEDKLINGEAHSRHAVEGLLCCAYE
jgi:hypothetical protein